MKKLLALLLLPLSSPLFGDRHIEGLSLKGNRNPQATLLTLCCAKSSQSIPTEIIQKNVVNAGFSNDFIQETGIIQFVSSSKKPSPFEIIVHARGQVKIYNEEHGTELDSNKLSLALFAHNPKFNECLKMFEEIDKGINNIVGNAADNSTSIPQTTKDGFIVYHSE